MTELPGISAMGRRLRADITALIVDPDATDRRQVKATLQSFGLVRILEAADGSQALRLVLKHGCPDLVITELATHPLSGIQLLRILRRSPGKEGMVPVIMLTDSTERQRILEARELRCSAWLLKPVSPSRLFAQIVTALGRADAKRRLAEEEAPSVRMAAPRRAAAANVIDFAKARARLRPLRAG